MRLFLVAIAAFLMPPTLAHADTSLPADQTWGIFRDGSKIGDRTTTFERNGEDLIVETESNVKVKIAFITVYKRSEKMREVWHDGDLAEFVSEIDDDGDKFRVEATRGADGLAVNGSVRPYLAPDGTVPATFWNVDIVSAGSLLETKQGKLLDVSTAPVGREPLNVNGTTVFADRYTVDAGQEWDLWYDDEDELILAKFATRDGSVIEFRKRDKK